MAVSLAELIDALTREGELYEKLPKGDVRCYACGHRCLIHEGKRGICKVRFNKGGTLYVPTNYVAALQCDPTEKKPFFHVLPGSTTLTFGMLGCDYHCSYCIRASTVIATSNGPISIGRLFHQAKAVAQLDGSTVAILPNVEVYTHTGKLRPIRGVFRHRYTGRMIRIKPQYLLPIHVTPEHEFLVVSKAELQAGSKPSFVQAAKLTPDHYLAIPKRFSFSTAAVYETAEILKPLAKPIRYPHELGPAFLKEVLRLTDKGLSSKEISHKLGKDASHIRHLRSKLHRGVWNLNDLSHKQAQVLVEEGRVRFSKEHAPGIPEQIPLDEKLARLLGYYAAEGCVLHHKDRGHSAELVFALGHHERTLAEKIQKLVREVLGVEAWLSKRHATLCVVVGKASVALLFEQLCGTGSQEKRIPVELFNAPRSVVESFLEAYVEGDGHRYEDGKVSVATVSKDLAAGVAWLALKTGRFPALYRDRQGKKLLGRLVQTAPYLFTITWYQDSSKRRWLRQDDRYYYVPIRKISTYKYNGYVYNLEVDTDHSYLAQFVATHNCQNYLTSQALRDPAAGVQPMNVTAERLVALARRYGAKLVGSSYNEPLITAEWAVEVFKLAKGQGLKTCFISNGNATKEVLEYLKPWCDAYKVDLKSMSDRNYRKLGGLLRTVLETIQRLVEMGFWVEIVTLVVPGFNDSDDELRQAAKFLVSLSPDIPWHVTAFHKDYKMTDPDNTPPSTLIRAAEIGREAGLRFVYAGNLPGRVGSYEHTFCPTCQTLLIERFGFEILRYRLTKDGRCPSCSTLIPGIWWD